jgi:hypothetical protein
VSGRRYLTVAEVLYIHAELVEHYGGAEGVRDLGALESALFRPQSGYYEDLIQEACALLESLAMNHPFIDGNKRVAFGALEVFLMPPGPDPVVRARHVPLGGTRCLAAADDRADEAPPMIEAVNPEVLT